MIIKNQTYGILKLIKEGLRMLVVLIKMMYIWVTRGSKGRLTSIIKMVPIVKMNYDNL